MTQITNTLQFTKNFLIQMSNRLSPSVKTELDSFLTTISKQETFLEDDIPIFLKIMDLVARDIGYVEAIFEVTKPITLINFGIFSMCINCATTIRQFAISWAETITLLGVYTDATFEEKSNGKLIFSKRLGKSDIEECVFVQVSDCVVVTSYLRNLFRKSFNPSKVILPESLPIDSLEKLRDYFKCEIESCENRVELHFDKNQLDTTLPAGDPDMSLQYMLLASITAIETHPTDLILKIKNWYIQTYLSNSFEKENIFEELNISSEQLRTHLMSRGTSLESIRSEIRFRMATLFLQQSSTQVKNISLKVGYGSSSAFNKAYKKWTGQTPNEYRKGYFERLNSVTF